MPAVLNTNVASLWASKNLLVSQEKMASSVERLSSGLRINRARDDAAGLGVANSLTRQINGANQGIRNLNDGISMTQTAEAAITAASDMGQRILTLATQGANATLGIPERKAIQAEMSKLLDAIDAIGGRTKFSGNPLLSVTKTSGQSEYNDPLYVLQISNQTTDVLNLNKGAFYNVGIGSTSQTESSTLTISSGFTSGQQIVVSDGVVTRTVTVGASGATVAQVITALAAADATTPVVVGSSGANTTTTDTIVSGSANFRSRFSTSSTSSTATFTATGSGRTGADVANLDMTTTGNPGVTRASTQGGTANGAQATDLKTSVDALLTLLNADPADLSAIATKFRDIQGYADTYVVNLGTQRSLLGAYQNQIEYTVSNVTELSANLSAARSRVQDTDYAAETANLTKGQILQQAATAMLAQANQMPNVILTLLK